MTEPAKKVAPVKPAPEAEPAPEGQPAPPVSPGVVARELRRKRARSLALRLGLGVGLPTLIAAVYFGFVATPQYESVGAFTIQSADNNAAPTIELLVASVPGSGATRDAMLVQQYVQSRDMLRELVDDHGFVEHYSAESVDWWSRLPAGAPLEDAYDYYDGKVDADYDSQSSVVTVNVRAFSAEKAHELASAILASSERKVNEMMEQARRDRIDLAQREVSRAEERLGAARARVLELQGERSEINPLASAEAILGVRSGLEVELAEARAELNTLRASLQPGTPQLVAQQQRVAALARQVQEQSRRLAASDRPDGLNADIAAFEPAMAEKEFAQHAYESALKSMEIARVEASRQHRYLVMIARPSQPDEATHPRVFLMVLTVFVLSFALLGIGTLLLASIREHANL
jgi:capsular polysaccharide transport system permease protein